MPSQKILARGAEAILTKLGNKVLKNRITKGYRHPDLDKKLRKRRTKSETKLITKANKIIPSPKVLNTDNKSSKETQHDNYQITMQYIPGKKLSDNLEKLKNYQTICKQIGKNIALLHDAGIIHGDLTTSNMILATTPPSNNSKSTQKQRDNKGLGGRVKTPKVYFIDFGLGFHSNRIEDKAVDLHLIKQALEAKHSSIYEKAFKSVLVGYKASKNYKETIKRLEKVEKRGRYKQQY